MRSSRPKVLHTLAGRPLVEHAVRAVAGLDPAELAVVVGHGRDRVGEALEAASAALGREIGTAVQEPQRGTGDAVRCALPHCPSSGTVVVTYADTPLLDTATLAALVREHRDAGNAVTVLTTVLTDPCGYGRVLRTDTGEVAAIVEERDADEATRAVTEVNSGVYAFDSAVLRDALSRLSTGNAQGELYLTDVLALARSDGRRVDALACPDPTLVAGVNDRVQLAALGRELNTRLLEGWMRAGVTVLDPASTWVDMAVALEPDVTLEPGVQLRGGCTVGEGAIVGPDCTLTDVRVGPGAQVVRTHGSDSVIGAGAHVGPFAYLRPGTVLGTSGKIGTFVEVKNSEIGQGTKVPHLTYVGDATIGEHSNIGASSVFVNYDGSAKHRTVVGSYAKTGSDTMFVAPVEVGDGAYSGAGTVIREDVPPGALAVSTGTQRNIHGWVARRRPGSAAAKAADAAEEAVRGDTTGDEEGSR
jgi:bifunctional UDP-N-acetylglucosamine pyrophosphorylase/glucosamine-1-phosphate N-acetyltransferase